MFFVILMLLSALSVSAIAAYYSIIGLIAIFAASPAPIAIMGASLEVAKLVTASWLYKNWDNAPRAMKYYFTIAVVILVFITFPNRLYFDLTITELLNSSLPKYLFALLFILFSKRTNDSLL